VAEKMKPKTIDRATTHPSETRPNIPTAELESFARPEENWGPLPNCVVILTV
jgi:hypothetical protein